MREPLLKFMHVLRALEYSPKDGNEVELDSNSLDTNVGMSYLRAASVFNFYQSEYRCAPTPPTFVWSAN
jgi:hypothetical protein